jgi:molybdopterin-guanine dinucleotide biosynthesis protein A
MGGETTPKPLVRLAGRPLAAYPLHALREAGATEIMAIGGAPATLGALAELGYLPLEDTRVEEGPLAGIVRALDVATEALVVVLACDTPFVTASLVTRLVDAAGLRGCAGTTDGRLQPLIAVYATSLRSELEAALTQDRAVHTAVERLRLPLVELAPEDVVNVNTPDDLRAAEARLAGGLAR